MTIPLFGVVVNEAMEHVALEVLRSGQIASGPYVEAFRKAFCDLVENPYVVTTNDMSNAVMIALRLAGVEAGDEVITSPYSCMSTNAPIGAYGAQVVWTDIDPQTGAMSPESIVGKITPKTRAVVLYHVAGYPGPANEIRTICRNAGISLIEDCDNALGAKVDGAYAGSFGDYAVYSFYPNRQINAIDGGALVCRSQEDFARAMCLRRYGIDSDRFRDRLGEIDPGMDVPELGWAATLNNLSSAMGLVQLDGLRERQTRTRANAIWLTAALSAIPGLNLVRPLEGAIPAYWALLACVENRDEVLVRLKASGVSVSKLHHRNDTYTGFHAPAADLPGVTAFMDTVIGLPCGWWLSDADLRTTAGIVADVMSNTR